MTILLVRDYVQRVLSEGLLKIPTGLADKITRDGMAVLVSKVLYRERSKATNLQSIPNTIKWNQEQYTHYKNKEIWENIRKTWERGQQGGAEYTMPFSTYRLKNNYEIASASNIEKTKLTVAFDEFEMFIFQGPDEHSMGVVESWRIPSSFEEVKTTIETWLKQEKWFTQDLHYINLAIKNSETFIAALEKFSSDKDVFYKRNFYYPLTPELFGQREKSSWKWERLQNADTTPVNLWIKFEPRESNDQKFVTSGGESYSGYYAGVTTAENGKTAFKIAIVLPQVAGAESLDDAEAATRETIIHELGHMMQEIYKIMQVSVRNVDNIDDYRNSFIIKSKTKFGGLPPRKISAQQNPGDKALDHEARDIEFYTRLGDTANNIKTALANLEASRAKAMPGRTNLPGLKPFVFKILTGMQKPTSGSAYYLRTDSWLAYLLANDRPKWSKAVKELYKELFQAP